MSYTSPGFTSLHEPWLDVDFPRAADETGNMCGMLPPPDELMSYSPSYEASQRVYPESQWRDLISAIDASGGGNERFIREVLNQGREPSCTYNAGAQAMHIATAKAWGVERVRLLSPISGYRFNGTPRSGSSVPGCIVWLEATGLLPRRDDSRVQADIAAGLYAVSHPATGYSVQPAANWKETAKHFRAHEWFSVRTVEAFVSALIDGWVIVGGRDGHAICHVRPMMSNGAVISMYANSWGAWGATQTIGGGVQARGFGYDSRAKIRTMVGRGAWALRTVVRPTWLALAG